MIPLRNFVRRMFWRGFAPVEIALGLDVEIDLIEALLFTRVGHEAGV